ncbi:MAG: Flp pilus assembly complex ATPase component TadA [Bacteriovoracaceae bacterium]|jgi:type II secretory ATPase GspE/PulE/Tfp pilus assembly ATPase PilB-like protein|nr:Flp pilus assembly complex ATPase component TadA [Bacteriovoracaceae bacterium]
MSTAKKSELDMTSVHQLLKKGLFLSEASDEAISFIAENPVVKNYKEGDPVFIENEASSYIYFVESGSVEIVSYKKSLHNIVRIKVFGLGDHFSELSALTKSVHSTSCFALENTTLYVIDQEVFYQTIEKFPLVGKKMVDVLAKMHIDFSLEHNYIDYFKEEDLDLSQKVVDIMPITFIEKYKVLPLKTVGNLFHVAMRNPKRADFFEAMGSYLNGIEVIIHVINESDFNGNLPRVLKYFNSVDSINMEQDELQEERDEIPDTPYTTEEFLQAMHPFASIPPNVISQILPYIGTKNIKAGEVITRPGRKSPELMLIKTGKVNILKDFQSGGKALAATLGQGKIVGEISLISETDHLLTVVAQTPVTLLTISKEVFAKLFQFPAFSISLAELLAKRLQELNREIQLKLYDGIVFNKEIIDKELLPLSVITSLKIMPIKITGDDLVVGLVNPKKEKVFEVLNRYLPQYRITLVIIDEDEFERVHQYVMKHQKKSSGPVSLVEQNNIQNIDPVKYLEDLVFKAYEMRASDIHIDPFLDSYAIRIRVDGNLSELQRRIDYESGKKLISRIKVVGEMDITEKRFPQDGQLKIVLDDLDYETRVSMVPSKLGEKCVMRLIGSRTPFFPLKILAPDKKVIKFLKNVLRHKQGLFLITGPTGSGKTTTLYSLLHESNSINKNIITIEDPVEVVIPGITQIEVKNKIGLTCGKILKHVLRQDPDIIMVGEVRDDESAKLVFEAALTGHLVFATLHTNSSMDIVPRLRELGVSSSVLASGLIGVMAQRLIPALCPICKEEGEPHQVEKDTLAGIMKSGEEVKSIARNKGCDKCSEDGYIGRIPVYEYWEKCNTIENAILSSTNYIDLVDAVENTGEFRSLYEFGLQMVLNGLTTIEKVDEHLYGTEVDRKNKKDHT